jgi:hypothetical protein
VSAFSGSELRSIHLPVSVEAIGKICLYNWRSITLKTTGDCPFLKRLHSLTVAIHLIASFEVIWKSCFSHYDSLQSIPFGVGSRLFSSCALIHLTPEATMVSFIDWGECDIFVRFRFIIAGLKEKGREFLRL